MSSPYERSSRVDILLNSKMFLRLYGIVPIPLQHLPSVLRSSARTISFLQIIITGIGLLLYLSTLGHFLMFKAKTNIVIFVSIFFTTMTLSRTTAFFLIVWKRSKLLVLMDDLEEVVNKRCENVDNRRIYSEEIEKSERSCYRFLMGLWTVGWIIPFVKIVESYIRYFFLHNGASSFKPLMPATMPLEWKTPKDYAMVTGIQFVFLLGFGAVVLAIYATFLGISDLMSAFCRDINENLLKFNGKYVKSNQAYTANERIKFATEFFAIIDFHIQAKELTDRFNEIFSYIVTALFGISIPGICTALLNLNAAINSGHRLDAVRMTALLVIALIYIIFLCLHGDRTSTRFDEINTTIWDCSTWPSTADQTLEIHHSDFEL